MVLLPASALAGLNNPVEDTPVPLQTPPGVAAVSCTAASLLQNGPTSAIVASINELTLIAILTGSEQVFGIS